MSPTRAEQKQERREALIRGGVTVLAEHGLEGFTTGRLATAAGIAQSGFYTYFSDRDAALLAVARRIGDKVLLAIRESRMRAASQGDLQSAFAHGLRAMLDHRESLRLALRFRREPGPLGDNFRDIVRQGTEELLQDMQGMGMVRDPALGHRFATYTVGLTMSAVEGLLDGELDDIDQVAADLAHISMSALATPPPDREHP